MTAAQGQNGDEIAKEALERLRVILAGSGLHGYMENGKFVIQKTMNVPKNVGKTVQLTLAFAIESYALSRCQ